MEEVWGVVVGGKKVVVASIDFSNQYTVWEEQVSLQQSWEMWWLMLFIRCHCLF